MKITFLVKPTELRPAPSKAFQATRSAPLDLRSVVFVLDDNPEQNFVCGVNKLEDELVRCLKQALGGSGSRKRQPASSNVSPERVVELRSMPYAEYLKTSEWARTRQQAIERARGRCQVCNSVASLEAHHRCYDRLGEELPSDLTVLCSTCHELFHDHGKLVRP